MRDYSNAPSWATEAFFTKSDKAGLEWYYGNEKIYIHKDHIVKGIKPSTHTPDTLKIIAGSNWWRDPINYIVENE